MRSSAKRRVGRPRSKHRPVLAARVPEEFLAQLQASARAHGRNASEELIWRAQQGFEWEAKLGTAQAMLAETRRIADATLKVPLEQTLRERGYTKVQAIEGAVWFEPGVNAPTWVFANVSPESRIVLQEMLDQAATRALEKLKAQS
jgi:Arc-like DNA binding dprotein